jgi:hypothetical protein
MVDYRKLGSECSYQNFSVIFNSFREFASEAQNDLGNRQRIRHSTAASGVQDSELDSSHGIIDDS